MLDKNMISFIVFMIMGGIIYPILLYTLKNTIRQTDALDDDLLYQYENYKKKLVSRNFKLKEYTKYKNELLEIELNRKIKNIPDKNKFMMAIILFFINMVVVYTILSAIIGPLKSIRLDDFLGMDNLIYFGWFTVFVILVYNNSDTLPKLTKEWYPSPSTRNLGYNPENQSRNPDNINNYLMQVSTKEDEPKPDLGWYVAPSSPPSPESLNQNQSRNPSYVAPSSPPSPRTEFTWYNPSTWSTWFRN